MAIIEINRDPGKGELRWFGLIFLAFFVLVGLVVHFRLDARQAALWIWGCAAAVTLAYYAAPPVRKPLYLGWMYAAFPVGWVMSHVVLGLVFYLVFTPVGLLMRLFGRDPMQRRFRREAESYWQEHDPHRKPERYFRQF